MDVLVPDVNSSRGVFVAARVDRGGCTSFLARGIFFFVLFGHRGQAIVARDLGETRQSFSISGPANTYGSARPGQGSGEPCKIWS